jgi:predicted O-linked N-acetylglucosamine transferase (SPINDLY family)
MITHIEDLFNSVGDRFEGDLIETIVKNYVGPQKEVKDAGANKGDDKKKDAKKKDDKKKDADSGLKKDHFKPFVEAIEKENYHIATIELLELGAKMPSLDANDYYHALLMFCFVALRKYSLAEFADKVARKHNPEWDQIFDDLADEVYDSGLFFAAESLNKDVRKLELEVKMKELEWEKEDILMLTEDLIKIFRLENEKLAKTLADEKFTPAIDDKSTLDDVIIALCDEFILPFYARLELQKTASQFKD